MYSIVQRKSISRTVAFPERWGETLFCIGRGVRSGARALLFQASGQSAQPHQRPGIGTSMPKKLKLYTLRLELLNIEPLIWRRIQIAGDASLGYLHHTIQAAFGWEDAHLHEFEVGAQRFVSVSATGEAPPDDAEDESKQAIEGVAAEVGDALGYRYDFGDDWEHRIVVERIESVAHLVVCASVTAGERACPPEDIGGPHGYASFLVRLKSEAGLDEATRYLDRIGPDFDPELFDRYAANATLIRMARHGWGNR